MPDGKGMIFFGRLTGIEGTKSLLRVPVRLPFGLYQVEGILSPHLCHMGRG